MTLRLVPIHTLPRLIEREFAIDLYREIVRLSEENTDLRRDIKTLEEENRNLRQRASEALADLRADPYEALRDVISNARRERPERS